MRSFFFAFPLTFTAIVSCWLLTRMVTTTSPQIQSNVAIVLLLLFTITGSLVSLLSWKVMQHMWGENRFGMSLRHGMWVGLFLIALPILRWLHILTLLVIGGLLLIIFGMESLIILQQEPTSSQQ